MRTTLEVSLTVLALSCAVMAQTGRRSPVDREPRGAGLGRLLADIAEDIGTLQVGEVTLDDLATSAARALREVDHTELLELNARLIELEQEEQKLAGLLDRTGSGFPLDLEPWRDPQDALRDLDGNSLESANQDLLILKTEFERLERERRQRLAAQDATEAARRLSRGSVALLESFSEIPPAPEPIQDSMVAVVDTAFPDRMARALYRTGDFVGALRHYKRVPEDALTSRDRYEMARCYEEAGAAQQAIELLKKLEASTAASDPFWHARASNLRQILEKSQSVSGLLRKD